MATAQGRPASQPREDPPASSGSAAAARTAEGPREVRRAGTAMSSREARSPALAHRITLRANRRHPRKIANGGRRLDPVVAGQARNVVPTTSARTRVAGGSTEAADDVRPPL